MNAGKASVKFQKLAGLLSGVDCLALGDGLGKDGIKELRGILSQMKSQIEAASRRTGKRQASFSVKGDPRGASASAAGFSDETPAAFLSSKSRRCRCSTRRTLVK
jgi:hypothetical protein